MCCANIFKQKWNKVSIPNLELNLKKKHILMCQLSVNSDSRQNKKKMMASLLFAPFKVKIIISTVHTNVFTNN